MTQSYKVLGFHPEDEEWNELFGIFGITPEIALAKAYNAISIKHSRVYRKLKVELSEDN